MNQIEQDKRLWVPEWVDAEMPSEGSILPTEPLRGVNLPEGTLEAADDDLMALEMARHGRIMEPELARLQVPGRRGSYISDHPTSFVFRADVRRLVNRVQSKFPYMTFANTYWQHPPIYGNTYDRVSVDFWGGGISNGNYVGYRGKPIWKTVDGNRVFNAIFNDKYLPNVYWIIWNGGMWTRGYGWGPAPWGPADSDAGHYNHIHITYL